MGYAVLVNLVICDEVGSDTRRIETYIVASTRRPEVITSPLRCVCLAARIYGRNRSRTRRVGDPISKILSGPTGHLFPHAMYFLVRLALILSLFTSWSSCFTKFIRPPERDPDEQVDQDMSKNNRYTDGDTIPIIWDTNIKHVDLYVWQVLGDGRNTKSLMKSRRALTLVLSV